MYAEIYSSREKKSECGGLIGSLDLIRCSFEWTCLDVRKGEKDNLKLQNCSQECGEFGMVGRGRIRSLTEMRIFFLSLFKRINFLPCLTPGSVVGVRACLIRIAKSILIDMNELIVVDEEIVIINFLVHF